MKAALEPFRVSTPPRELPLLPHLREPHPMLYDIALEVGLTPEGGRETFAEMDPDAKHAISHRADAFASRLAPTRDISAHFLNA